MDGPELCLKKTSEIGRKYKTFEDLTNLVDFTEVRIPVDFTEVSNSRDFTEFFRPVLQNAKNEFIRFTVPEITFLSIRLIFEIFSKDNFLQRFTVFSRIYKIYVIW